MKDSLRRLYVFFFVNYFVQSAVGIAYEPINYLLKDTLKLTPGEASGFYAWATFPLLLKPAFGFMTDFFPIGGHRRKPHLAMAALVAAGAFFALALESHYTYLSLLVPVTLSGLALAFADAVCGGILVEDGKARQQTGRYQALHIGALYFSIFLVGVGAGWMTTHVPFHRIFAVTGAMPLVIFIFVFFVHEKSIVWDQARPTFALWKLLQTKTFWALGATIVLWNFYPFLGTVQFYYQSNILGLSPQWIGSLMSVGSLMGLAGSAVFWKFYRGCNVDTWISWGPVVMALVSLAYLGYRGAVSVVIVESLFGFASVFFRVALLDLVARTCPTEAEASAYALFLALIDLSMYGSNVVGGKLYDILHSYMALIFIGAGSTFACRWTLKFCRTATV